MLKFLSGRKRSRNVFLIFFIAVLTLSLVGLFSVVISGGASGILGGADEATVAKVGGYRVSVKELRSALAETSRRMATDQGRSGAMPVNTIYDLMGEQVINQLVRDKVILYESERLNIKATDEDIQAYLNQYMPARNPEQYRSFIKNNYGPNMTPVEFEERLLRPSLTQEHLKSYITAGVQVSLDEVREQFRRNNTTYEVKWAEVNPDNLIDRVSPPSEADLRAYFDQHQDDFRITSEQRRARFVFIDQKRAGQAASVPEEDLKKSFDEDPERYIRQVRVSQIVINVPKDKDEEIRKKAQDTVQRARGSEGKPAEDFAALARATSEDAPSKAKGGDIGIVEKSAQRDNNDPLNSVFNLKQGEISEPIKKNDKYYIFKVTERKTPTFAEARQQILEAAQSGKAYDEAVKLVQEAETRLKETKNPEAVAQEINTKYNSQLASVRDTGFFAKGDRIPTLEDAPDFEPAIFEMQNLNDVTTWMKVNDGFAVAIYTDKREPNEHPGYEEVSTTVDQKYRRAKAEDIAKDIAAQIAQAKTVDEFEKRAKDAIRQYGAGKATAAIPVRLDQQPSVKLGDSIGPLVSDQDRAPVYKLNTGEVTSTPIRTESGSAYVVAAVANRTDPKEELFEQQRKSIEQALLTSKREVFYQTYIAMTIERLKQEGTIKIYKDVADKAIKASGPEATEQQSPFPGMPSAPTPGRPRRTPQGASPGALPGRQ